MIEHCHGLVDEYRRRCQGAALGYVLDRCLGEAPPRWHPLVHFGRAVELIEGRLYADRRGAGVRYAALGIGGAAFAGTLLRSTAVATYLCCGGRALGDAAGDLRDDLDRGDLVGARRHARALVSRDTEQLDQAELARAAIESVAENTVDAVVAPLFYAALGGARGVIGHRASNTLDALVGYHNERYEHFGWASARLDDVAAFVPARLVALLVMMVRPRRAGIVLETVRRDAGAHPSPNAGVAEAAFAAALGLRLGGPNSYRGEVEVRPYLGAGRAPEGRDISAAIALSDQVAWVLVVLLVVLGWRGRDSATVRR